MLKPLAVNSTHVGKPTENQACAKACTQNNGVAPSHTPTNTKELVPVSGTYCVVIQKQLITTQCPLPKGSCFWKHRISGECKYESNLNLGVHELANRVGASTPSEEKAIKLKDRLLRKIKKSINT